MKQRNRKKIGLFELIKLYPTEEAAQDQFTQWRWRNGEVRCPHCDGLRIRESDQKMPYRCKDCRKRFSVRTGTIMARSNLSYRTWVVAVYLLTTNSKGISSTRLGSELGVTQKTAWHLSQRIRKSLENSGNVEPFYTAVEIDETYMVGKERNKHKNRRLKAGRGAVGNQAVIGIKKRGGNKIRAQAIDSTNACALRQFIGQNVSNGATVYIDGYKPYKGLALAGYQHETVEHSVGEYVNGKCPKNQGKAK